ncbi:MAG: MBL fold metallo-hydrolase, partial [Bacteroidaceae bacterium]|nr:MBL fold metallo-hydrolase [Bacteroidaceae bacterium]
SHLRQRLPYCLVENKYPGVPQLQLHDLQPYETVMVNDTEVTALQVMHGQLPVLGYRIGNMAYITDMTSVTPRTLELLSGIRLLVVNGLRHRPHRTHQTIDQAIAFARQIGNQPTYIIHMSHDIAPHAQESLRMPQGIHLAYDGLAVEW